MTNPGPKTEALTRAGVVTLVIAGLGFILYLDTVQIALLALVAGAFAGLIRYLARKRTGV